MSGIFLTLPNTITVRNIVHTGVLGELGESYPDEIHVFPGSRDWLTKFGSTSSNISVYSTPLSGPSFASRVLQKSLERRFYEIKGQSGLSIREAGYEQNFPWRSRLRGLAAQPFKTSEHVYKWVRGIESRVARVSASIRGSFNVINPDLLWVTDPSSLHEYSFLREAKRRSVPTVGFIRSWDIPSAKGYLPVQPDYFMVWNSYVAEKLESLHNVTPDRVFEVGVPQFDVYVRERDVQDRDQFLISRGLDPSKKTVLYAGSPKRLTEDCPAIVEHLSKHLPPDYQILVRVHPQDGDERWQNIVSDRIAIQVPGSESGDKYGGRLIVDSDISLLADSLASTDVTVSVWSTMTIDASAAGRPSVICNFDMKQRSSERSIKRSIKLDHVKMLASTGAAEIVESSNELISAVVSAVETPGSREDGRKILVEKMCGEYLGSSGSRISGVIRRLAASG